MKIKCLLNPGWSGSCRALIGQLQCVQYEQFYLKKHNQRVRYLCLLIDIQAEEYHIFFYSTSLM